ncbi:hypothetical protein F2Q68_00009554 [Brassica cretica]|uniref:Uncharacterized protein n=1 Tax=Brassica cretica TaxID=69181 RepID=A0A8S9KXB6_BRACR|nr:hypothetical protein F2Q68_00009554 [Brassica cretica]
MAQIRQDLISMEDDCAPVVVLWSPSLPPASDSFRLWVYGELPGGGGDSLLVVSPCSQRWQSGEVVRLSFPVR